MIWRRYFFLALIVVLLLSSIGNVIIVLVKRNILQQEAAEKIKSVLPDKFLTVIKLPSNEASRNLIGEGEFQREGHLYDVAHVKDSCGIIYCYCFDDKDELKLYQAMNNETERCEKCAPGETTVMGIVIWSKNFNILCYFLSNQIITGHFLPGETYYDQVNSFVNNGFKRIFIPPPRVA